RRRDRTPDEATAARQPALDPGSQSVQIITPPETSAARSPALRGPSFVCANGGVLLACYPESAHETSDNPYTARCPLYAVHSSAKETRASRQLCRRLDLSLGRPGRQLSLQPQRLVHSARCERRPRLLHLLLQHQLLRPQ